MSRPLVIGLALALLTTTLIACSPSQVDTAPPPNAETAGAPVWAVDLVRTLPGAQLDYVRSIEMTEYADSAAYANREETFQAIFASPEFVAVEPARPSPAARRLSARARPPPRGARSSPSG